MTTPSQTMDSKCIQFRLSKFYAMMRISLWYMNMAGVFVPVQCLCEQKDDLDCSVNTRESNAHTVNVVNVSSCDNSSVRRVKVRAITQVNRVQCDNRSDNLPPADQSQILNQTTENFKVSQTTYGSKNGIKRCKCYSRSYLITLRKVYCALCLIFHIFDLSRFGFILPKTYCQDTDFVYALTRMIFQMFFTFLFVTSTYALSRHYLPVCYLWFRYESMYGLKCKGTTHEQKIKVMFLVTLVFQFAFLVVLVTGIIFTLGSMHDQSWPFDLFDRHQQYFSAASFGTTCALGSFCFFSANSFRGTLCRIIYMEFQDLREQLLQILSDDAESTRQEKNFDDFVKQLKFLCTIMDKTYDVIKHGIASVYIFTLPLLCVVLYGLVSGSMTWDQMFFISYSVLICVLMIITTTQSGSYIGSGLSIFMHQLSVREVGYTVYGMFTVDGSSLLMVGGTILTYGILVVQLRLGDQVTTHHCLLLNKTS